MKQTVILAGGSGTRMWPYNEIRNKGMLPVANKPILLHTVDALIDYGMEEIYIFASFGYRELTHTFRKYKHVFIKEIKTNIGNTETLLEFEPYAKSDFFVLFADCLITQEDLSLFLDSSPDTVLIDQCRDNAHNHIVCRHDNTEVKDFIAHPRGMNQSDYLVGLHTNSSFFPYLHYNPGKFYNTKVGVGSPLECFLEQSLNDYLFDFKLIAQICQNPCFDIDKPWHLLEANSYWCEIQTKQLNQFMIDENASIDDSARILGYVQLGKNSKIGKNVCINGNCIIGDNTVIDNGATIDEYCIIGNNCIIQNYCKIGSRCAIGDECIIEQTAEMLGGVLMRKDYLYHHGEFFGLCGECVDLGAGTICGTLRFDDGETIHSIKGRKEIPIHFSNATYLGDYVRSGVGVIFQPGATVGCHSVIGSGVVLNQKVQSNKCIYVKQELIETDWSVNKYGW